MLLMCSVEVDPFRRNGRVQDQRRPGDRDGCVGIGEQGVESPYGKQGERAAEVEEHFEVEG